MRGLISLQPAARWEDGYVTGNGTLGAIVWGDPAHEIVIGNHSGLWLPLMDSREMTPAKDGSEEWYRGTVSARRFVPDVGHLVPAVREIIRREGVPEGYRKAHNLVCDEARKQGYMGYQCPGNYHPGFKLHLEMPTFGPVRDYRRTTDFESGEVRVGWEDDAGQFDRRLFASRSDGVIAWSIRAAADGGIATAKVNANFRLGIFEDIRFAQMTRGAEAGGWLTVRTTYDYGEADGHGGYVAALRNRAVRWRLAGRRRCCPGRGGRCGDVLDAHCPFSLWRRVADGET